MDKLDITWGRAVKIWWAFFWRGILYTFLITFPVGIVIGVVAAMLDVVEHVKPYASLIGMIMSVPIGIWIVRIVFSKQFSDFRIVLVPSNRAILERVTELVEQTPAEAET